MRKNIFSFLSILTLATSLILLGGCPASDDFNSDGPDSSDMTDDDVADDSDMVDDVDATGDADDDDVTGDDSMIADDADEDDPMVADDIPVADDADEDEPMVADDIPVADDTDEDEPMVADDIPMADDADEDEPMVADDIPMADDADEDEPMVADDIPMADDDEVECTSNSDCAPNEVCNGFTGLCFVVSCAANADCPPGEVCNLATSMCETAPGLCGDNADCPQGEVCDLSTGFCVESDECDNLICAVNGHLCDDVSGLCATAEDVAGDCAAALNSGIDHSNGAPVIISVEYRNPLVGGNCNSELQEYVAEVFAPNGLLTDGDDNGGADPLEINTRFFVINESGQANLLYNFPDGMSVAGTPGLYEVYFQICSGFGSELGVVNTENNLLIDNTSGETSNVFCFTTGA